MTKTNPIEGAKRIKELQRIAELESNFHELTRFHPSKLLRARCLMDEELTNQEYIVIETAKGHSLQTICGLIGLTVITVRDWLQKGRSISIDVESGQQLVGNLGDDGYYYEFYIGYRKAKAELFYDLEEELYRVAKGGVQTEIRRSDSQDIKMIQTTTTHDGRLAKELLTGMVEISDNQSPTIDLNKLFEKATEDEIRQILSLLNDLKNRSEVITNE